ncbi:uncharacterized protein IWZ02DRAFT_489808 [Phyllosticta citriasiana]|uniref:uncharacterized protein n=1 Tax=Phyllosticta citriasiana TaxID=595635 RepID=UPI0030FD9EE0
MVSDSPSAAVSSDCSSFMTDTTTLAPITETTVVTTTITPPPVEALLRQQYASENGREPAQGDDVPMYAWPCDVDRYAEVCSCLGFPATTVTELAWTAIETLTLTKTQTLSGSPVFPNVTRSLASSWQDQCDEHQVLDIDSKHWIPKLSHSFKEYYTFFFRNGKLFIKEPSPLVAKRSLFERTVRRLPQPFSQCHLPFDKDDHANSVIRISVFQLEHFRHIWLNFCSEYPAPYPEFDDNVRDHH